MLKLRGNDIVDKVLKVAKLNIRDMIKRIIMFYLFTSVALMFFVNIGQYVDILLPMIMDILTFIFLLTCMMNTLKNKFNFAQGNNISRNTFIKGSIISIFPVAALMAVIDFAINRTMNLFVKAPTIYDLLFTSFGKFRNLQERLNWVQDGSINAIIGSIIFSFLVYGLASIIGLVIGVGYLRISEKSQLIWSGICTGIWIYWLNSDSKSIIFEKFTISENNRGYLAIFIYILIFSSLVYSAIKLIKKAVVS